MATPVITRDSSERGQAIIEMALCLPLLLIVIFGIIDFGFMFQRYEVVTNAAREGARIAVLEDSAGYTNDQAEQRAIDYLRAGGINGTERPDPCGGAEVRYTVCAEVFEQTVTITGSVPAKTVTQKTVIVEYDHEYSFVGPLMRLFGAQWGTIRIRAASSMRME